MIILPGKEQFIRDNFIEYSFNKGSDHEPDFELFKKLNATDQYYLADQFNWDDGIEVLGWIIESPNCDKGTAALIFWRSDPEFYLKHSDETISKHERDLFLLLKRITERFYKNDFRTSRFAFDPSESIHEVDWQIVHPTWLIPKELMSPIGGIVPISLGKIRNLIWQWQRQWRLAKRNKRKLQRKNSGKS